MGKYINVRPAGNFHHAIRIAEAIDYPLNSFISINFSYTACPPDRVANAFQKIRQKFGKWATRPPRRKPHLTPVPATFVWVLERPQDETINCHWLVHVPRQRKHEFRTKLHEWVEVCTGGIHDNKAAINIRPAKTPRGAGKYMLKGMHPHFAAIFGIKHEEQGWIDGRRSGFTRNLGPTQKRRLRAKGGYPPAKRWVSLPRWLQLQRETRVQNSNAPTQDR